jgi:PAT family beta-lactamase induction signal transducer AmpG
MAKITALSVIRQPKMFALLLLGFSSGLPLFLTSRTLQAWMTVEGVDLTSIGLFSLVALPYSLKVFWAPLVDRYVPPILGRRRGWILITQIALLIAIGAMALQDPRRGLQLLAFNALMIALFSATLDIAFDAYKIDVSDTEAETGLAAAVGVLGYRIALLVTGALAFVLADSMPWPTVYLLMAAFMVIGIVTVIFAPEPATPAAPPASLTAAIRLPFQDFFARSGAGRALLILAFIIFFRYGDALAQNMVTPFLLQSGYTSTAIGAVQGGLGLFATIVGVIAGGLVIVRLGIGWSLLTLGIVQAASNLVYYALALVPQDDTLMVGAIIVENLAGGLGTAAFVAFMMSICSHEYSATQYALFTSLNSFARDVLVAPAGGVAEAVGWPTFFLITLAAGVPGLVLLMILRPWRDRKGIVAKPVVYD